MADSASPSDDAFGDALLMITARWRVSFSQAVAALVEVAPTIGLEVSEQAAAAEHQQRVLAPARAPYVGVDRHPGREPGPGPGPGPQGPTS